MSILITGCNRGIGLGLVKEFLKQNTTKAVIATCRDTNKATDLVALTSQFSNLKILTLDLKNFSTFKDFGKNLSEITAGAGLNLLINNAGITTKFTRIEYVKLEQMQENLVVNTLGPIMLTKECLPLLKQASKLNSSLPMGIQRSAVINISSILGSMGENVEGGFYPYRCSKSALNAATKSLSVDLKRDAILAACIHPGWIKTDMGGKNAPLEIAEASSIIVKTLLGLSEKDNGAFIQYNGKHLSW